MKKIINKISNKISKKMMLRELMSNNAGMGVVEVIFIILGLISLAVIFKSQITTIVNSLFTTMTNKVNTF